MLIRNVSANLLGTIFVSAVSLASAPVLFREYGPFGYGLIGIYLLLQALMPIFDMGLSPGVARAISIRTSDLRPAAAAGVLRVARWFALALAACAGGAIYLASGLISSSWIDSASPLDQSTERIVILIGTALAIRLVAGVYRTALMAMEDQIGANVVQSSAAAARTFGALAFSVVLDKGIDGFFIAQIPVSLLEWLGYRFRLSKHTRVTKPLALSWDELGKHVKFSAFMAGLSIVWAATTQVDRAIASKILSIEAFGNYAFGVQVSTLIPLICAALNAALLPKLTGLISSGNQPEAIKLYRAGLVGSLTMSIFLLCIVLASRPVFPFILGAVDGDPDPWVIAVLAMAGQAPLATLAVAYQLQNAFGRLRCHAVITVTHFVATAVIGILIAAAGTVEHMLAGLAAVNVVTALVGIPFVHHAFLPKSLQAIGFILPTLIGGTIIALTIWALAFFIHNPILSWLLGCLISVAGLLLSIAKNKACVDCALKLVRSVHRTRRSP